jgi:excisionase family DNA binding protein
MSDNFNPTEFITTKEAAELTGYDDAHIRRLVGGGRLPALKRGGVWFLDKQRICGEDEVPGRVDRSKSGYRGEWGSDDVAL